MPQQAPAVEMGTAEAELRAVDREYAAGAMNAFGPPTQQERILAEMESVGRLQGSMMERANAVVQLTNSPFDTANADQGTEKGDVPQHPQVSALHDGAFEDMSAHFAALEGSMGLITEH
jgi:hypothetical protein